MTIITDIGKRILPLRWQGAVRYKYKRLTRQMEPELALLGKDIPVRRRSIDVGANKGSYTYRLSQLCSTVEAFEPIPDCLSYLKNLSLQNVNIYPFALSDREGSAELHMPLVDGRAVDITASLERRAGETRDIVIATELLDNFVFEEVDFIKIDVEGHEAAVLRGARETIRQSRPWLLIEIEQCHLSEGSIFDVFEQIRALGYIGWFLRNGQKHPLADFDLVMDQADRKRGYINNFIWQPVSN